MNLNGHQVGYVRKSLALRLNETAPDFLNANSGAIRIQSANPSPQNLTGKFENLHKHLSQKGLLPGIAPEKVDVRPVGGGDPLFRINRNLIFPFGIRSRGGHLIMRYENGDFLVSRRSDKVMLFRGCYDVTAGGILPASGNINQHVFKEALEEANLSENDVRNLKGPFVIFGAREVRGDSKNPAFPYETNGGTDIGDAVYWEAVLDNDAYLNPNDGEVSLFVRMSPDELASSLQDEPENWKINSGVMYLHALSRQDNDNCIIPSRHREKILKLETLSDRSLNYSRRL